MCTGGWQGIIWAMPKRKSVFFFWEGFPNFAPFPTEFAVNSISQADFPVSDENTYFQSPSKHLKGQLGPRVGHITFFNQRRSVVSPCLSHNVFESSTKLRRDVENTSNCILAQRFSLGLAGRRPFLASSCYKLLIFFIARQIIQHER